ncbi:ABC transporter substrate-binding protein [Alicyclobacillus acidocaldarius]|uniref:Extracellular solute-binding protein family 1 n=1 Tax=Alicyclobacillus acidocaldarius (strain Tc-4-1) TaxID=1048834 RepID=F8IIX0_ALIAT|nr:ABC transporter substrate-binding protein [Alicyclobacillus acidocaldarius]AEJ44645.1 extracellular solute-binding protein family 1 [Alicyclobacillus acidocaldarius subsp. acidocaldarius Tc-4-1]
MRKKRWTWTASAAAALVVAGCGTAATQSGSSGSQAGQAAGSADSKPVVTLTFGFWGDAKEEAVTLAAVKAFEKVYPNIHIQTEFGGPFNQYFTKLSTEVAGGNAPDIMQMDYDYIEAYAKEGQLLDLKGVKGLDLATISPSVLRSGYINGGLYGIPNAIDCYSVIYDQNAFAKAGYHGQRMSWDQWANLLEKVHKITGRWAEDDDENWQTFGYWTRQYGQHLYNAAGTKLGFTQSTLVAYLNYWANLRKEGAVPPGTVTSLIKQAADPTDPMVPGKSLAEMTWDAYIVSFQSEMTKPLGMSLPPTRPGGPEGLYLKPSQFWSIYSKTRYPEQAELFVNFLLNNDSAGKALGLDRGIPVSSSVRAALERAGLTRPEQQEFTLTDEALKVATPIDPPPPQANNEIDQDFANMVQAVQYGKETAQQGAEQFMQEANDLLQNGGE